MRRRRPKMKQSPFVYWLEGALYTVISALTPISVALASNAPITPRMEWALAVAATISGCTALKSYMSGNPCPGAGIPPPKT